MARANQPKKRQTRRQRPALPPAARVVTYALEQLFVDQDFDWVIETIAPVVTWVPRKSPQQPFRFGVSHTLAGKTTQIDIDLVWNVAKLAQWKRDVVAHAQRLVTRRSAAREHVTELAAYGLAFVAISALMPGRRVVNMTFGVAPDMLLDLTPGALRGVEVAGRTTGGASALAVVRNGTPARKGKSATRGKRAQLLARADIAEVHLALWCADPRIGIMEQVK